MKNFVLVVSFCGMLSAGEVASRGAVVEALCILENKQRDVLDVIQELKKELTLCFLQKHTELPIKNKRLDEYHCKVKRSIYPRYIDKIELLLKKIASDSAELSKEEPLVTSDFISSAVEYAFLLKDKIELEFQLVASLFALDTDASECSFKTLLIKRKQKQLSPLVASRHIKAESKIRALKVQIHDLRKSRRLLEESVRLQKKNLQLLKKKLETINEAFYRLVSDEEHVHIDKLVPFK